MEGSIGCVRSVSVPRKIMACFCLAPVSGYVKSKRVNGKSQHGFLMCNQYLANLGIILLSRAI